MTRDYAKIAAIKKYFDIKHMSVNKLSECDIPDAKVAKFLEGESRGYYIIQRRL